MKIKTIEINNFRIYRGHNIIDVIPEQDKNIIIVSGRNGYGKTTFLMSLVWCMYGKQMIEVDELYKYEIINKQRTYQNYMVSSINRLARVEGEHNFSVSITFTELNIPIDIPCKELKITRSFNTLTQVEELEILINGSVNEIISTYGNDKSTQEKTKKNSYENFIRDFVLPKEIAKFFFFDAEKIVSLAEINTPEQRRQLSTALSEVIGIKKYENLKEHVSGLHLNLKKASATPEQRMRLNQLNTTIDNNVLLINTLKEKIQDLDRENGELNYDWKIIDAKLMSIGHTITEEEYEKMKLQLSELQHKKKTLSDQIKNYYEIIPFGIVGEKLLEVFTQINQEFDFEKSKYIHDNVENKTNQIVNDLYNDYNKEKQKQTEYFFHADFELFLMNTIKKLIKKHVFPDDIELPLGFTPIHHFSKSDKQKLDNLINHLKFSFKEELKRISSEHTQAIYEIQQLERKKSGAETKMQNEIINDLRKKRSEIDLKIKKNEAEIQKSNFEIERLTEENKNLKRDRTELAKTIESSDKNKNKEYLYKKLINELNFQIRNCQSVKQKSLENRMLNSIKQLMHMKLVEKVQINIENEFVDVKLINHRGEEITKESLSKGQQQIYASALLKSLVEESEINFPVFIDSPMQKFDETHSENIIRHFYPNVSEQVVIFPLINKELTFKEYQILKPSVAKTYLINNINADKSEFQQVNIDELIN